MMPLPALLEQARACRICSPILEPRPIFRLSASSRILIVGQAPGSRVHASGIPWDDASGDHLREWLGVERSTFDDPELFGILPTALCYPGRGKGGDLPPPKICAATWHEPIVRELEVLELVLLVGSHAQRRYLGPAGRATMTETVRAFDAYLPSYFPLPHPSWRSRSWIKDNPWFTKDVLPALRERITHILRSRSRST